MRKQPTPLLSNSSRAHQWEQLFEAALIESDRGALPGKLQDARAAVLDRIEDSFDSASFPERRTLLAALHAITELQRLSKVDDLPRLRAEIGVGHAS